MTPAANYAQVADDIQRAILDSPESGLLQELTFWWGQHLGELGDDNDPLVAGLRKLIAFCKRHNFHWAIRAIVDEVMRQFFPSPNNPLGPQIDVGFRVMAPGGTARAFPILGITSVEPAFSFHPRDTIQAPMWCRSSTPCLE